MNVNDMNLTQVRQAIGLAEVNLAGLKPEARTEVEHALNALRERERRLVWVAGRNRTIAKAIARNAAADRARRVEEGGE